MPQSREIQYTVYIQEDPVYRGGREAVVTSDSRTVNSWSEIEEHFRQADADFEKFLDDVMSQNTGETRTYSVSEYTNGHSDT